MTLRLATVPDVRALHAEDWPRAIGHLRRSLGLSQQGLSTQLGTTVSTVNRWERGRAYPAQLARRVVMDFAKTRGIVLHLSRGPL